MPTNLAECKESIALEIQKPPMPSAYKTAEAGSTGLVRDGDLRTGEVAVIDGALICPREGPPDDFDTFAFGAPKEEEDDDDCVDDDDDDHSGCCNSRSKAYRPVLSTTTPAPVGFHGTTTTHHGTLSFECANKSCCNTEAAANGDIDGTQSTDGTQSSPTTLPTYEEEAKRWGHSAKRHYLPGEQPESKSTGPAQASRGKSNKDARRKLRRQKELAWF